jgi:DNA-binding protein YbaB
VVSADDIEMFQDLMLAAFNEAIKKAQELAESEMSKVTGNLNIPGLPGIF